MVGVDVFPISVARFRAKGCSLERGQCAACGGLGFFFRQLYNELACTYDLVAWVVSLGQWKAWGRTAIPHLPGKRVLELGHGPGHLLVAMAERGLTPVGLDLSLQVMLVVAGKR